VPFSKFAKIVQFLSIFAKTDPFFAKNASKYSKSAPKTFHFGAPSLLRRCF